MMLLCRCQTALRELRFPRFSVRVYSLSLSTSKWFNPQDSGEQSQVVPSTVITVADKLT